MSTIKIHYYEVSIESTESDKNSPDLNLILEGLSKMDLDERLKTCRKQQIRLDNIQKRTDSKTQDTYWVLGFSRFRHDNWPGVAQSGVASSDLTLDDDAVLAEETAMAYWPTHKKALIQYNHFGVRAGTIEDYFNQCAQGNGTSISLLTVLTEEAMKKYAKKQIVTSLEASVSGVTEGDVAYFNGTGLKNIIASGTESNASRMRIQLSVDAQIKSNKLDRSWVDKVIQRLLKRGGDRDKLVVSVREDENDAIEILNLLEERKVSEFDEKIIEKTRGRRYIPEQLEAILTQAFREWQSEGYR